MVDAAESSLKAIPGVVAVRRVRMRWIGLEIHADADLDINSATSLADAHDLAHVAEHDLVHAVPKLTSAVSTPPRRRVRSQQPRRCQSRDCDLAIRSR